MPANPTHEHQTAEPTRSAGWRILVQVVLVVFVLPMGLRIGNTRPAAQAGYGDGSKPAGAPDFDGAPLEALRAARPDYVVIGNSNTYTRVDDERLGRLLGGRVLTQASDATAGVHWFLQVKNHLIASGIKPRKVLILFRDDELVAYSGGQPELRLAYSHDPEPAFRAMDQADCTTIGMRLRATARRAVTTAWPLFGSPRDSLFVVADSLTPASVRQGLSAREFHIELNRRFGLGHLRADAPALIDDAAGHVDVAGFSARAECSTLPHLLAAAREAGLELIFVRIQRRSWSARDEERERQMQALARYLDERGAAYLDLCGDPAIQPEWYGSIDHIADAYRGAWTDRFYARLVQLWGER